MDLLTDPHNAQPLSQRQHAAIDSASMKRRARISVDHTLKKTNSILRERNIACAESSIRSDTPGLHFLFLLAKTGLLKH
ncbi:hypothetical protein [Teichococcus aestuarii]|uniref:hypothetical protein n=1 Tax=Teichococcus aestuarii TaxID=568898 RepID=UPI0011B22181|nr:hypothetical protein [Pseudoroseomonas aestuarii]